MFGKAKFASKLFRKQNTKKSPLRETPLRNPGQSLDEEIESLWSDKGVIYLLYIAGFLFLALYNWYYYLTLQPIKPVLSTIVFLIILAFYSFKLVGIRKKLRQLRLARDGEKLVGQYLDILREEGARILHDIRGENFNVDHVIVSEHGVFVVDTKTYQKPIRGNVSVKVDHDEVYVNNYQIERNPIQQSRALTKWIHELLVKSTGRDFPVQGVVVFPGWFVEPMTGNEDIWVLNHKALPPFIRNTPAKIKKDDVYMIYYHLSLYVQQTK